MSSDLANEWVARLTATGCLAAERQAYRAELIRLGEPDADANVAAEMYVPDPKMLGQAAHAAGQIVAIKKLLAGKVGPELFRFPRP